MTEAIYTLLMMEQGFIAPSINISNLDPEAEGVPVVANEAQQAQIDQALSNSFGFGGTNCSLVFRRLQS